MIYVLHVQFKVRWADFCEIIMKQYVIDELRPSDHDKIKAYMDEHFPGSEIERIYWLPIDPDRLADVQVLHIACQPFFFAIELMPDRLAFELLVRTKNRIRCQCIQYATESQRNWLIGQADAMLEKLEIIT